MTKETAITFLYGMRAENLNLDDLYTKDRFDALTLAIKSLEQGTVTDFADKCRVCGAKYGKLLKQEPKTGHWIIHEKPHGIRYLECPCCNVWYLNEHLIRNSYCPNCGTKMVEPQESEEI